MLLAGDGTVYISDEICRNRYIKGKEIGDIEDVNAIDIKIILSLENDRF